MLVKSTVEHEAPDRVSTIGDSSVAVAVDQGGTDSTLVGPSAELVDPRPSHRITNYLTV